MPPTLLTVRPQKSRARVRDDLVFSAGADAPAQLVADYRSWELDCSDIPSQLVQTVGPEWVQLRTWVEGHPSLVHLANLTGENRQTIPHPDELAKEALLVAELGVGDPPVPAMLARPGRPAQRFEPVPGSTLWLRCVAGQCRVRVTVVPGSAAHG